jgi:fructose-1-phosphate kinase PfkB-like protein
VITVLSPSPALDVSYLVDALVPGGIHRPRAVLRQAGGKGLNIARAARVLGERVRVVAPLGGRIGALVRELAAAEGLDLEARPAHGETRMCVSAIADDGSATEFYEPAEAVEPFPFAADWPVLAGRVSGTLDWAGRFRAVDTSGPGLAAVLDTRPDIVKVNRSEAAAVLERGGSALDLAAALRERTAGTVVVTDGAAGAVAVDAAGAWRARADPRPGRFAIGSGDSFFAGLLVTLADGGALPDALRSASAAGSANSWTPGAGVFDRAEYDAALLRIEVVPA